MQNSAGIPRYLLVSSGRTLDSFSRLFGKDWPSDLEIVATTSAGIIACIQARLAYTPIDYYTPRECLIELGWQNYTALDAFCRRWDAMAQERIPELAARAIKPFRFGYFDLKILIDCMSTKLLMLENFVRQAAGAEIYYLPELNRVVVEGERIRPREDVDMFALLLQLMPADSMRLVPLPAFAGLEDVRAILRSWRVGAIDRLRTLRDWFRALRFFRKTRGCNDYLCFNWGHDIQYIVPYLSARQFRLSHLPIVAANIEEGIAGQCRDFWGQLLRDKDFNNFFSCGGTGYFSLVKDALEEYVSSVLPRAIGEYDSLRLKLSRMEIWFSLTGTINLGLLNRCHMLAAQRSGAPLITYQEGAGYGSIVTPIYDYTEATDGDAMLCYGAGNPEYYEDAGIAAKLMVPVGSAHQDMVRNGVHLSPPPERILTVMYVSTAVDDNVMHCPNNGLVSTAYRTTQIKILRLMNSLPGEMRVIMKPKPNDVFASTLLCLAEFGRIKLETRRFENVLNGVDLFILDFPSTVLLSSLITNAYVFILAEPGVTGFTSVQRELLERRCYIFDDFDALATSVRDITADMANYPPRLDDGYLVRYSLYKADGKSAERAADALVGFSKKTGNLHGGGV